MWFRVDDGLHGHPKTRAAGLSAMGLWVLAGSYSIRYRLDGHVPASYVASFPNGRRLASCLVTARLWDTNGDGWLFRDWSEYQASAADMEAHRKAEAERIREYRRRRADPGKGVM